MVNTTKSSLVLKFIHAPSPLPLWNHLPLEIVHPWNTFSFKKMQGGGLQSNPMKSKEDQTAALGDLMLKTIEIIAIECTVGMIQLVL